MRAAAIQDRPVDADETILPSHAWMVGVAVEADGTLVPPPEVVTPDDSADGMDSSVDAPDDEAADR